MWQRTPYTIPLFVAAAISIGLAVYYVQRRRTPSSRTGMVLLCAAAEWMIAWALEQASFDLSAKLFWAKMKLVALCVIPTAWLIYTLQYTGREKWLTRRSLALLGLIPLFFLLLIFSNEVHGLIWASVQLDTDGPFAVKRSTYGPGFGIFTAYSYTVALLGILVLVQTLVRSHRLYRWQLGGLLLIVFTAWLITVVDLLGLGPFPDLELTPLTLGLAVPITAWSLYRLRRRDIVPVARSAVVEGMSDGVVVLDAEGRIVDLNAAVERMIEHPRSEAVGRSMERLWPGWMSEMQRASDSSESGREVRLGQGDGQHIYDMRVSPLTDWRGHLVGQVVVLRDITERKRAEERIRASLEEKEVLLKEVHHRVKNNLQVISSLLYLQGRYTGDEQTLEMLRDSRDRVRSMALAHERLYQSPDVAKIDFAAYIRSLVTHLFSSYRLRSGGIALELGIDDVSLGLDTAIPCGLIVNELVSNALKHAFPEGTEGRVRIDVQLENGRFILSVSDDGLGFPADLDFRNTESLGLQLVIMLVEQLEGEIELDNKGGTTFRIAFAEPLNRVTL
jgi:PAS domain S-box-containing protein